MDLQVPLTSRPARSTLLGFARLLVTCTALALGEAEVWRLAAGEPAAGASRGLLLVCNKGDQTLGIIDSETCRQIATIPEEGVTGHEVAASPDGKYAFVPIYGNSGVGHEGTDGRLLRVVDLEARKIVGTVDFGKGVRPHCAVIGPKNGMLYVTTELDNSVTVIDPKTLKITGTIPTGEAESHMLAITSDGKRGFTSNVGPGTVSVLDLERRSVVKIIPISKIAQRISLSVDDRWAFVADQTRPQLAVINTASCQVEKWVALPGVGYGTARSPDGRWLLVAVISQNLVAVVDLETMLVARTVPVPKAPQEILVRPDGRFGYVACDASRQVAVLDLREWKVDRLIEAGPGADGLAWAPR
jgi:YVTN family beta-propeller protein